jgi:hypothetical protein
MIVWPTVPLRTFLGAVTLRLIVVARPAANVTGSE